MARLVWSNDGQPDLQAMSGKSPSGQRSHKPPLDVVCHALQAGEHAPGFRLLDQHGHVVTLATLVVKGPVVLRFCRCDTSSCFRELDPLVTVHIDIERQGATLAVIPTQPLHPHPADNDPAEYAFMVLTDKGAKVARSYGLTYHLPPVGRSSGLKLPNRNASAPATYVIDQESVIALAFIDPKGHSRMEPDQIVTALECLNKRTWSKGGTPV
jgi:peroxiredoxin